MPKDNKKTVTIKLTAKEANWLLSKLDSIQNRSIDESKKSGSRSALEEAFKADSLMDRINSES